uniref:Uncharacterized protein n=1 Tax=Myotis myotis TaxID=51298 RepID=A0A7J7S201_MYOMY|nr:hypothetical protein mMyoMyo1_010048 [Myotis myotis]
MSSVETPHSSFPASCLERGCDDWSAGSPPARRAISLSLGPAQPGTGNVDTQSSHHHLRGAWSNGKSPGSADGAPILALPPPAWGPGDPFLGTPGICSLPAEWSAAPIQSPWSPESSMEFYK